MNDAQLIAALQRMFGSRWQRFAPAFMRARDPFLGPAARPGRFRPGDVVTRAGDDRQRVTSVDEEGYCMTVVCIEAPALGWCEVGDEEHNLCRRYQHVGPFEALAWARRDFVDAIRRELQMETERLRAWWRR